MPLPIETYQMCQKVCKVSLLSQFKKLPIAFGGASISGEGGGYGFGDISEADAISLLHEAFERGLRVFDTAPIYGFGLSEQRMGKAFKSNREEAFIVSKSGVHWHENKRVDMTNDPVITQKMLEQSLRDLQSDYIDLYMIHWPDEKVDIRKPFEVLVKAQEQGKIKHLGLCNTNIDDLAKASQIGKVEVVQSEYNFFNRKAKEDLFYYLKKHEMSFMSWGTLDKGILTKRVDKDRSYDKSDCRSWAPWWDKKENAKKIEALENIWPKLEAAGHTGLELALAHNLMSPELSMALCGAKNSKQLNGLFDALENLPSEELVKECLESV